MTIAGQLETKMWSVLAGNKIMGAIYIQLKMERMKKQDYKSTLMQ